MRNRRRSVLIAESNRAAAQGLRQRLEQEGFLVLVANDGEQACILAARQRFELIITSLELNAVSGLEFCRHVREELHLTDVPIAVCSKGIDVHAEQMVESYGITRVFSEPIDHTSVVEFAKEIIGYLVAA